MVGICGLPLKETMEEARSWGGGTEEEAEVSIREEGGVEVQAAIDGE